MDNLNDLKTIWHTAKTDSLPAAAEMLATVKSYRDKTLFKKGVTIVIALVFAGLELVVVFLYRSHLISTRIGEACIIIACGTLAVTNARSIKRFHDLDGCSNAEFVQFLYKTRQNQSHYYHKTQVTVMAFCAAGVLLYIFEAVYQYLWLCIACYAITLIYLAMMWFVVRPRMFKKNGARLNQMIARAETLSKQLKKEDI